MQNVSTIDRIPALLIGIAIVFSPWPLGSNRDWAWPAVTILTLLATFIILYRQRSFSLGRHGQLYLAAFLTLLTWMTLQYVFTTWSSFETRVEILKTVTWSSLAFCLLVIARQSAVARGFVVLLIIVAVAQALLGAAQQLLFDLPRARGSYANPNHLAGYLIMAACLGIGLTIATHGQTSATGDRHPVALLVGPIAQVRLAIVILVIALVMTRSRVGNLAFIAGITLALLIAWLSARQLNRFTLVLLVSVLVIDVVIIGNLFGLDRLGERFQKARAEIATRVDLQVYNLRILGDQPWTGTGAGTYEVAFKKYRDADVSKRVVHAENDYAELLVELGIIGVLPLLALIAISLHAQWKLLRANEPFTGGIALGCLAGTFAILLHGFADVNLQIPANTFTFVILLTLPVALHGQKSSTQQVRTT